jgi:hypothetical protein
LLVSEGATPEKMGIIFLLNLLLPGVSMRWGYGFVVLYGLCPSSNAPTDRVDRSEESQKDLHRSFFSSGWCLDADLQAAWKFSCFGERPDWGDSGASKPRNASNVMLYSFSHPVHHGTACYEGSFPLGQVKCFSTLKCW